MKKCLKIRVMGAVQGVGYRAFVKKSAEKLGIVGTAQNMSDGSVLMYSCGSPEHLELFLDDLYRGTRLSKITEIISEPFKLNKDFRGVFRIIGEEE